MDQAAPPPHRPPMPDEPVCRFTVPICPSTNNLYLGRRWKTAEYIAWQELAGWTVKAQRPIPLLGKETRLRALIEAPLARNRDIENLKPILDLAQSLHLIVNDNRVDWFEVRRISPAGGDMVVKIWTI